jgi:hypothetical protein
MAFTQIATTALPRTPERALRFAILQLAINDLDRFRGVHSRDARLLYADAVSWVRSGRSDWPLSFVAICEDLRVDPTAFRKHLLGDAHAESRSGKPPRRLHVERPLYAGALVGATRPRVAA